MGVVAGRGRRGLAAVAVASVPVGVGAQQGTESARRYREERRSGWPASGDTERPPQLEALPLSGWYQRRRQDLFELLDQLEQRIATIGVFLADADDTT